MIGNYERNFQHNILLPDTELFCICKTFAAKKSLVNIKSTKT